MRKFFIFSIPTIFLAGFFFLFLVASEAQAAACPSAGLMGYWKMNESSWNGTAGEVADSADGHNGTAVSGANVVIGKAGFGNAGTFNGNSQYVDIPYSAALTPGQITFSLWLKTVEQTTDSNWNGIIEGAGTPNARRGTRLLDYNNALMWQINFGARDPVNFVSTAALPLNRWVHVVGTFDGNFVKLYQNGVQTGPTNSNYPGTINWQNSGNMRIGMANYGFNGRIDEVRVYNRALSPTEVNDLYGCITAPPPQPPSNVSGYAWSENIGWISFSSLNCDADNNGESDGTPGCPEAESSIPSYGVNIDESGILSGYAWSENIGWISFNRSDAGAPPGSPDYGTYLAKVDGATKKLSGWARALANGDGWDGWLKLGCFSSECDRVNYGISLNFIVSPVEFYSFSWSDVILGWLSFNCTDGMVCPSSNYKVVTSASFNQSPSKPGIVGETWNHCSIQGRSIPIFSWTYSDPDGDPQESYEMEVDDSSSFNAPKFNHVVSSNSTAYALDLAQDDDADWISQFSWNTTYFWRVRVKDNQGNWSEWSNADAFQTPLHAYPSPDFNWTPMAPAQGEVAVFNPDISVLYGGASITSYLWTIMQGDGTFVDTTNNASQYPHIIFDSAANQIKLAITDSDGYSCEASAKPVTATLPLPEYKEAPPSSWLRFFLTSLYNFVTMP